jgi:hypothetical protein
MHTSPSPQRRERVSSDNIVSSGNNNKNGYAEYESESEVLLRPTSPRSASQQRREVTYLTSHVGLNSSHSEAKQRATAATANLRNPLRSGGVENRIMQMMGEVCMYMCVCVCVMCVCILYVCMCVCIYFQVRARQT